MTFHYCGLWSTLQCYVLCVRMVPVVPEFGKCWVLCPIHADLHFKPVCQSLRSDMVKNLFCLFEPNISQCLLNERIKEKSSQKFYSLGPYSPSILLTVHSMSQTPWYQEELITPWSICKYFGRQTLVLCLEDGPREKDCGGYLAIIAKGAANVRDLLIFVILAPR